METFKPTQRAWFEEFWKSYPRKVGKEAARKAWSKIKPSKSLVARMLETVDAARQTDQWQRDNGRFIPNPATWLNQGRWDDEDAKPPPINSSFSISDIEAVMRQNTMNGTI